MIGTQSLIRCSVGRRGRRAYALDLGNVVDLPRVGTVDHELVAVDTDDDSVICGDAAMVDDGDASSNGHHAIMIHASSEVVNRT